LRAEPSSAELLTPRWKLNKKFTQTFVDITITDEEQKTRIEMRKIWKSIKKIRGINLL
jgi:hypothetical protein